MTNAQGSIRSGGAGIAVAVLWIASYFACRLVLEKTSLSTGVRVTAATAPIIPFAAMLWLIIGNLRTLDELHRRVQLEALAIAFPCAMVVLMFLGLLQLAVPFPAERYALRDIWPILPMLYFIGLAIAWRRYK